MGYFILEASLFALGIVIIIWGKLPLAPRRAVNGSAAYIVAGILMVPLPLYLFACNQGHVSPLDPEKRNLDALKPFTAGYIELSALLAAAGCGLAALVLAIVTSEKRPRKDHAYYGRTASDNPADNGTSAG